MSALPEAPKVSTHWYLLFKPCNFRSQRTGQLDALQAEQAWEKFEKLVGSDLQLLPVEAADFHRAALLTLDAAHGLRAGDVLHLACAERAGVKALVTLDAVMAKNAGRLRLKAVALSP